MTKKETMPQPASLDPPEGLSDEMVAFWKAIISNYDLSADPAGLKMLKTAVEAGDRVREARAIIAREGLQIRDRFDQPKPHPMVAVERDFRTQFLRALRELAIDPPEDDPRPPRNGR